MSESDNNPTPPAVRRAEAHVYKVNAHEWWLAHSLEEALSAAATSRGVHESEVIDELAPPYRLTDDELRDRLMEYRGGVFPLVIVIDNMIENGVQLPTLFATSS